MKIDKTKSTVLALIALIIVCGGSFIGVRMLNKNTAVKTSSDTATVNYTTTAAMTETSTTAVTFPTTDPIDIPSTLPLATLKSDENESKSDSDSDTTKLNPFTTFADVQNVDSSTTKKDESSATTQKPTEAATS
ncbi:MAG: hypothetical protein ACI4SB_05820, partial [Acutalibacteraceae bacterium]